MASLNPRENLQRPSPAQLTPHRSVNPRRLTPLEPPPVTPSDYPPLPFPRNGPFFVDFEVSTHIFPAAYPRCPSDIWNPPPPNESPKEKKKRIQQTVVLATALKEAQERDEDTRPPLRQVYWTVANRYFRPSRHTPAGLTLVFLHGIGGHKETWEPTLRRLLELLGPSASTIPIQEIWALECVQHGDSGLLNEPVMGDTFDCAEYARDLANFLLSYLPEDASRGCRLPTNLPRVAEHDSIQRKAYGVRGRTIVGIGHSIGACSFVCPAVEYPALFSSLVLVESFTIPEFIKHLDAHRKNEALSLSRRYTWGSRKEAMDDLAKNPYYRVWDPKTLKLFFEFALVNLPDGTVRTKTHPYLETLMYFERRVVYETWELLEKINPSIPMHWVWGGKSGRQGSPSVLAQTSFRRASKSTNDYHANVGHLPPQEIPDLLASDIHHFLLAIYGSQRSRL